MRFVHAAAVTPNDSVDLAARASAFVVGANGTIKITTVTGDVVTLTVTAGTIYPILTTRIWSAGTSATSIVALR